MKDRTCVLNFVVCWQADIPVHSVVGNFAGYTHSSKYLMAEHAAGIAGGMGVLQG